MDTMRFVRKPWFFIPALLLLAVGLYAMAGYWLAPRLLRAQAIDFVDTRLGMSLALGEVRVDPFRLTLDVRDIAITDPGGARPADKPLVALEHLFVDLEGASLWERRWNLSQVRLEGPYLDAQIRPDGSLNLADLVPPPEKPDAPLPALWLQALTVSGGRIDFADHSRSLAPTKAFSPIDFSLKDFSTAPEGGGFSLATSSAENERLQWSGQVSLRPLRSQGRFRVGELRADSVYGFFSDMLPMRLTAGRFDLAGDYRFEVVPGQGMQLEARLPAIDARDLRLRALDVDEDWIQVPEARLGDTRVSLHERHVGIASLHLQGMAATLWRDADGRLNLERLLAPPAVDAVPAPDPGDAAADWTLALGEATLQEGDIRIEDRMVAPAARFHLAPTRLVARSLSLDFEQAIEVELSSTVNDVAPLAVSGSVVPATVVADLQVEVSKMPIEQVRAYLPALPTIRLECGVVAAKGRLALQASEGPPPGLRFTGDAGITGFELVEATNGRPFLAWRQLDVGGLEYTAGPDALKVARATLTAPFARVTIAEDRTINLVELFGAGDPAPRSVANASAAPMPVDIARLVLRDGAMAFADLSIDPDFRAGIEALRGTVTGLSTTPRRPARIDLQGHVINRFSPVRIEGETHLAAYDQHTDVRMAFENIELPIFNPYSGRWAGYAISKGKLSTELHYRIDDRRLVADHHVVINQLEWGDATGSKDKVSLPIRLGTSLLKDRNGVIDLDLPVTGTLDDPSFRIGPVVWKIIRNLIVKVVTAPFAFLGSLFEGAEQARYVDFEPGSAALPANAGGALSALAKGLGDRPALNLDIPAGAGDALDAQALQEQRFLAALAEVNGNAAEGSTLDYAAMDAQDRRNLLEALYRRETGSRPEPPQVDKAALAGQSWSERRESRRDADVAWLEDALRPRFAVGEDELVQLGQARAVAVQEALLADGGLDPTRVFLASSLRGEPHEGRMRVELALK
ncbi:DUF748 domain-containing protein [Marilutibacter aestuarii]|uniref:DUF748 domain-containing protein n=1 Tax=Marilutibacter aestuarii TaxID=1706195 RepID=A0A508AM90_9GAMM|nr:DUF748 domain-containing protein [Lysobacter aestuarii]TQD50919.1 DUF748 domain-containing protein [Lysobacter aestuarii]